MVSDVPSKWRKRFQYIYIADKNSQELYIPNIGFEDGIAIYTLIRNSEVGDTYKALELGSGVGYSTLWILYALEDLNIDDTSLIAVEMNQERANLLKQLLVEVKPVKTNYKVIIGDAIKVLDELDEKFDFIFVDISKNRYVDALKKLRRISHIKTTVLFHNAFLPAPPKEFTERAKEYGWMVDVIPTRVGMFLLRMTR